jgi:hypothetical protein
MNCSREVADTAAAVIVSLIYVTGLTQEILLTLSHLNCKMKDSAFLGVRICVLLLKVLVLTT